MSKQYKIVAAQEQSNPDANNEVEQLRAQVAELTAELAKRDAQGEAEQSTPPQPPAVNATANSDSVDECEAAFKAIMLEVN